MAPVRVLSSPVSAQRNFSCSAEPCSSMSLVFPRRRHVAGIFFPLCDGAIEFSFSAKISIAALVRRSAVSAAAGSGGGSVSREDGREEAGEALVRLLEEYGASREDSLEIVSQCPKYLEMLMDNVRELDEHSLWGSWTEDFIGEEHLPGIGFGKKVYLMAKKKGDKGVLPYLESIGLKYSSSVRISGYVSSSSLPELIDKVKFVKELLFSRSDRQPQIGKQARRMMMQLSISVDDDIEKTLSFFEKMEAKRGGLDMLAHEDTSLPCLVESFPHLLSRSLLKQLQPLVDFLQDAGVNRECIKDVILLFPPVIFYDIEGDLKPRIHALSKVGVEGKDVGKILVGYPWVLATCIRENIDVVYRFFGIEKVPKQSIDRGIKSWPQILGCSASRMKSMVKQFANLGVSGKALGKVIARSPQLLLRKPTEFLKVVSFMEEIGFDQATIGRILLRCPELFATEVDRTLRSKLGFFSGLGISIPRLSRVLKKYPELLLYDVDRTLLPRARFLMKAGLSRGQVGSMVFRFSPLLGYSVDSVLKPKLDFLVNAMGKPVGDVVDYPRYFSYSLEKRIEPRFRLLRARHVDCSLEDMLSKNDYEFAVDFLGLTTLLLPPPSSSPSSPSEDDVDRRGLP